MKQHDTCDHAVVGQMIKYEKHYRCLMNFEVVNMSTTRFEEEGTEKGIGQATRVRRRPVFCAHAMREA